jgi:hypothetical protein
MSVLKILLTRRCGGSAEVAQRELRPRGGIAFLSGNCLVRKTPPGNIAHLRGMELGVSGVAGSDVVGTTGGPPVATWVREGIVESDCQTAWARGNDELSIRGGEFQQRFLAALRLGDSNVL